MHAYSFAVARMTSALVLADPSGTEIPAQRARSGLVIGLALTVLVAAGAFVYGLVIPGGNTAWRTPGAIVVEKETGTRYVFLNGELRPTLNQASALLQQGDRAKVQSVSHKSLAGVPRGGPLGIVGAPDTVPTRAELVSGPWLVCATPGERKPSVVLDPAGTGTAVAGRSYAMVAAEDGKQYLVTGDTKHLIADPSVAIALGLGATPPLTGSGALLNALRDGAPIAPADADAVFTHTAENGIVERFVLRADGLAPISATEFALLTVREQPTGLDSATLASARRSGDRTLMGRFPDFVGGERMSPELSLCLRQDGKSSSLVAVERSVATGPMLRPGHGMVVVAAPNRYLVTDRGRRFLLPDDDSVRSLGFGDVKPVPVEPAVLALISAGPRLGKSDVGAAERTGT